MQIEPLIKMLNDISNFYETMPDRSKATADMAQHVRSFWDPRMRQSMASFLQQHPDGKAAEGELNNFALSAFQYLLKNSA